MSFFSRTVAERTTIGQRQSVQENTYTAHVYNRGGAEQLVGSFVRCFLVAMRLIGGM
jgi:synaptobrevin family protein YKT6